MTNKPDGWTNECLVVDASDVCCMKSQSDIVDLYTSIPLSCLCVCVCATCECRQSARAIAKSKDLKFLNTRIFSNQDTRLAAIVPVVPHADCASHKAVDQRPK